MTRAPYDVDLDAWLNKVGFHPADTPVKQLGFSIVRQAVANFGAMLHPIIPASDDKSTMYRLLGDVLMNASRALAVNGGPPMTNPDALEDAEEQLRAILAALEGEAMRAWGASLQRDARYEAAQLTDPAPTSPWGDHPVADMRRDDLPVPHRESRLGAEVTPAEESGGLEFKQPMGLPDGHTLDIPTGTGGHVRVTASPGRVSLEILDANNRATYTGSDPLSMLLQTIAAAGGTAFE